MNCMLRTATTDLPTEFCLFDRWNFFTGYRAGTGESYFEARDYPLMSLRQSIELLNGSAAAQDSLAPGAAIVPGGASGRAGQTQRVLRLPKAGPPCATVVCP